MKLFGRAIPTFTLVVAGWLAGLATIGAAGLAVLVFGLFDVRASTPDNPLFALATHRTMIQATRRRATAIIAPAHFTAAQVQAGFRRLRPGSASPAMAVPASIARGCGPAAWSRTPPYLLDAGRETGPRRSTEK